MNPSPPGGWPVFGQITIFFLLLLATGELAAQNGTVSVNVLDISAKNVEATVRAKATARKGYSTWGGNCGGKIELWFTSEELDSPPSQTEPVTMTTAKVKCAGKDDPGSIELNPRLGNSEFYYLTALTKHDSVWLVDFHSKKIPATDREVEVIVARRAQTIVVDLKSPISIEKNYNPIFEINSSVFTQPTLGKHDDHQVEFKIKLSRFPEPGDTAQISVDYEDGHTQVVTVDVMSLFRKTTSTDGNLEIELDGPGMFWVEHIKEIDGEDLSGLKDICVSSDNKNALLGHRQWMRDEYDPCPHVDAPLSLKCSILPADEHTPQVLCPLPPEPKFHVRKEFFRDIIECTLKDSECFLKQRFKKPLPKEWSLRFTLPANLAKLVGKELQPTVILEERIGEQYKTFRYPLKKDHADGKPDKKSEEDVTFVIPVDEIDKEAENARYRLKIIAPNTGYRKEKKPFYVFDEKKTFKPAYEVMGVEQDLKDLKVTLSTVNLDFYGGFGTHLVKRNNERYSVSGLLGFAGRLHISLPALRQLHFGPVLGTEWESPYSFYENEDGTFTRTGGWNNRFILGWEFGLQFFLGFLSRDIFLKFGSFSIFGAWAPENPAGIQIGDKPVWNAKVVQMGIRGRLGLISTDPTLIVIQYGATLMIGSRRYIYRYPRLEEGEIETISAPRLMFFLGFSTRLL